MNKAESEAALQFNDLLANVGKTSLKQDEISNTDLNTDDMQQNLNHGFFFQT